MKKGFTLAEVLITMTIIGIVSAVAIPSLMSTTSQKALDNQRHALYARMSNAISAMDKLGGYGMYDASDPDNIKDTAAKTFVVDGLQKVYKIKSVCDEGDYASCGILDQYATLYPDGRSFESIASLYTHGSPYAAFHSGSAPKKVAFTTGNGESILLAYNPDCSPKAEAPSEKSICAMFLYDLNGAKKPNQFGKDVGIIAAFYRKDPVVVAPIVDMNSYPGENINMNYKKAAKRCADLGDDYRLPDVEEAFTIYQSSDFWFPVTNYQQMWTGIIKNLNEDGTNNIYVVYGDGSGTGGPTVTDSSHYSGNPAAICVRK